MSDPKTFDDLAAEFSTFDELADSFPTFNELNDWAGLPPDDGDPPADPERED